jgi:hypothetical protein
MLASEAPPAGIGARSGRSFVHGKVIAVIETHGHTV